jgi:hypothetical protein
MFGSMTTRRRIGFGLALLAALATASPSVLGQQAKAPESAKYQFKVGLLPFVDNTASGDETVGIAISRAVQAEFSHSTPMIGRVLKLADGVSAGDVDSEKAVEIGKSNNVDVVMVGTVLEASSEESQRSVQSPSLGGQTVGGNVRSVKSVVTLQADLYNVVDGHKIDSIRMTGRASDTKLGTDVTTDFGSISSGGSSFDASPIGKALHNAVVDLVKKIAADQPKMLRNQPPTEPR